MTYGCSWSIFLNPSHSSPFYRSRTFRPWSIPPCCSPSLEFSDGRRPISDWLALFAFPLSPFLRPFRALSLSSSASDSFPCIFAVSSRLSDRNMSRKNAAQEGKERTAAAEEEAVTLGRRGEGGGLQGRQGERGCPRMAGSARGRKAKECWHWP